MYEAYFSKGEDKLLLTRIKSTRILIALIVSIIFLFNTTYVQGSTLNEVHITRALWQGDPRIVPEISSADVTFIVSTEETINGEDVAFKNQAGSIFILRAQGYPDVFAIVTGGFSTGRSVGKDNIYDTGFYFRVDNPDSVIAGVNYQLIAPTSSNAYKWIVGSDVSVTKGPSDSTSSPKPTSKPTSPPKPNQPSKTDASKYGSDIDPNYNQVAAALFSDVDNQHWAFSAISDLNTRQVLSGYPDGKFRPDKVVSRAEFAKIMVLAAGLNPINVNSTSFTDIKPSDWFTPYIEAAKDYLSGYSLPNGRIIYDPDAPALREDIAVAIVKLKGYDKTRFPDQSIIEAMFTDFQSISDYAKDYVALAVEGKLVSGFPDETFRAQQPITRAQAAAMLYRAYQYGNDNKDTLEIPNAPVKIPANQTQPPVGIIPPTVTGNVYGNGSVGN